ncbi:MAG: hypothetical protein RL213_498 [Bacteroidota bacterium]|jgi:cell division protein YceG involved in septum cleavage
MKNSIHLRLLRNAAFTAMIGISLTSCSKEELAEPLQQSERSVTEKTSENDNQARIRQEGIIRDESSIKSKEPVRRNDQDLFFGTGRLHTAVLDEGSVQLLGTGRSEPVKETGTAVFSGTVNNIVHEGQLLDKKEILGQNRDLDSKGDCNCEKTNIHDALDFTPTRNDYKDTGARED